MGDFYNSFLYRFRLNPSSLGVIKGEKFKPTKGVGVHSRSGV
ncbi:hypothetical protein Mrub_1833 [Meiothermus ruber DSM 1279]|uniref:Uncharacterized protein n=1 Tax=Meiothermus ruber (strain ATCC 35948 / DSM 1279 / VKM B-1258 / 21) TaxID=504728 RepID=A0A806CUB3_MEIRD|nr:hypothetical protein Mrub_1833 [Meiothermus ruber DSM 1279]